MAATTPALPARRVAEAVRVDAGHEVDADGVGVLRVQAASSPDTSCPEEKSFWTILRTSMQPT